MPMERPIDITAPKKDTEMKVSVDEFPQQKISDIVSSEQRDEIA